MKPEFIALGFLWYIAFLFSLTCPEAAIPYFRWH